MPLSSLLFNCGRGHRLIFNDGNTLNYREENVSIEAIAQGLQTRVDETNSIDMGGFTLIFDKCDFEKLSGCTLMYKASDTLDIRVKFRKGVRKTTLSLQNFLWGAKYHSIESATQNRFDLRRVSIELEPKRGLLCKKILKFGYTGVDFVEDSYSCLVTHNGIDYVVHSMDNVLDAVAVYNYMYKKLYTAGTSVNCTFLSEEEESLIAKNVIKKLHVHKYHSQNIELEEVI